MKLFYSSLACNIETLMPNNFLYSQGAVQRTGHLSTLWKQTNNLAKLTNVIGPQQNWSPLNPKMAEQTSQCLISNLYFCKYKLCFRHVSLIAQRLFDVFSFFHNQTPILRKCIMQCCHIFCHLMCASLALAVITTSCLKVCGYVVDIHTYIHIFTATSINQ